MSNQCKMWTKIDGTTFKDQVQCQVQCQNQTQIPIKDRLRESSKMKRKDSDSSLEEVSASFFQFEEKNKTYGSEDQSWKPGEDLQSAPEGIQQRNRNYSKMSKVSATGSNSAKRKGKKGKSNQGLQTQNSRKTRKGQGFQLNRIFQEHHSIKKAQEESDEIEEIDKDAYIKGIQEEIKESGRKSKQDGASYHQPLTAMTEKPEKMSKQLEKSRRNEEASSENKMGANLLALLNGGIEMPENYCNFNQKPQEKPLSSLKSSFQKSVQIKDPAELKKKNDNLDFSENEIKKKNGKSEPSHLNILGMLDLQQPNQDQAVNISNKQLIVNNNSHEEKSLKRPCPFLQEDCDPLQKTSKKIYLSLDGEKGKEQKIILSQTMNKELEQANLRNQITINQKKPDQKGNEEAARSVPPSFFQGSQLASKYMNNSGLRQRIQTQFNQLIQNEPIDLLDQENKEDEEKLAEKSLQLDNKEQKQADQFCLECKKLKQSEKSFVEFLKTEILSNSSSRIKMDFDLIYYEQETFLMVSGWNRHFDTDRFRKLVAIEKGSFLQSIILKNEIKQEEIEAILNNYKLSKIALVGNNWYGIFRVQKKALKHKQYCYIPMNSILWVYRQKIIEYLTTTE